MDELIAQVTATSAVLGKALAGADAPVALRALGQELLNDTDATPDELRAALADETHTAEEHAAAITRAEQAFNRATAPAAGAGTADPKAESPADPAAAAVDPLAAPATDPAAAPEVDPAAALAAKAAEAPAAQTEADKQANREMLAQEILAANDRAQARLRQQSSNDRTNAYLAYIVTAGFLMTILLIAVKGSTGNNAVLNTLLGVLGTGWASMMAFFFGSSVGSKEKNAVLGEANTPNKSVSVTGTGGS